MVRLSYEIFILESAVPKYKLVSKTYIFLNRLRRAFSRYFWISMRMNFKVRVSTIKISSRVDFQWRGETRNILKHIRFDCNWQYFTVLYSNFECYQGYWKYKNHLMNDFVFHHKNYFHFPIAFLSLFFMILIMTYIWNAKDIGILLFGNILWSRKIVFDLECPGLALNEKFKIHLDSHRCVFWRFRFIIGSEF